MIRNILVNLATESEQDPAAEYALSLAKKLDARVVACACAFTPVYPTTTPMELLGADYISRSRSAGEDLSRAAILRFEEKAKRAEVETDTRFIVATVAKGAQWITETARRSDLIVLGQANDDEWDKQQIIETVLFGSGRPVLVVPFIQKDPSSLETVVVCWDGSRAAARAVGDALPLLVKAGHVHFVSVTADGADPADKDEILGRIQRHGVKAAAKRLFSDGGDEVSAILNYVSDTGANLIVMGGYGHSRIREFVLGGVTRGILRSMTAPVLLSH